MNVLESLELWNYVWILHQDNTSVHNILSVREILICRNITVVGHTSYFPNLSWYDFFLYLKIKEK